MAKHTPEPWCPTTTETDETYISNAQGEIVASATHADDMRRIVACVNACAGIPTEALEHDGGVSVLSLLNVAGSILDDLSVGEDIHPARVRALAQAIVALRGEV